MKKRHFLVIFLSILAGVCFGVAITTHLLITGSLNQSYRAYVVQSGSMEPALPVGAIVFTKSSPSYQVGDIITFSPDEGKTLVTHRIFSKEQNSFRTKGDANEEPDNLIVNQDQIVGKSIFNVPKLGLFANFVRTPKGFVMLVIIPASIIVYEELKAMFNELKSLIFKNKDNAKKTTAAAIIIPFMGGVFMFVSSTGSFFQDRAKSNTNVISAADIYEDATPSPTPVLTEEETLP